MELTGNSFDVLQRVFTRTFGPSGVAALVQGPTGSMSLTRCGWNIVQSIYEEQNLKRFSMKLLFNNMKKVHRTLGDGVKIFLLIEIIFINKLSQMKSGTEMCGSKIYQGLQSLLKAICDMNVSSPFTISLEKREDRTKATSALFYTSCPSSVSSILESLFHDWVTLSLSNKQCKTTEKEYVLCFEFLFKNFDLLFFGNNVGSKCVSDSYVLSGYLIDKVAINLNSSEEEQVQVVLYTPDSEVNELEILFRVKFLVQENSSLVSLRKLLLTTAFLSEKIIFELKRQNVVILHGVSTRDVEFIFEILCQNTLIINNVITIKSFINGIKKCTCLLLPNIFQMLIQAPTDSLIREYTHICRKALKHLIHIAKNMNENGLVRAGGVFEKSLHFHIAKQVHNLRDPSACLVRNRKELLLWHRENQLLKSRSCSCPVYEVENLSLGNKFQNTSNTSVLEKEDSPDTQLLKQTEFSNLCDETMSQIPNMPTTTNSHQNCLKIRSLLLQDVNENILRAFSQSILIFCNSDPTEHSRKEVFEAISYKVQLLQQIIASAIVYFKCDIN